VANLCNLYLLNFRLYLTIQGFLFSNLKKSIIILIPCNLICKGPTDVLCENDELDTMKWHGAVILIYPKERSQNFPLIYETKFHGSWQRGLMLLSVRIQGDVLDLSINKIDHINYYALNQSQISYFIVKKGSKNKKKWNIQIDEIKKKINRKKKVKKITKKEKTKLLS